MTTGLGRLSEWQRSLVETWLPGLTVEADYSWGLVGTAVLKVSAAGADLIVKAGDEADHHLERELEAHRRWLVPWTSAGRAPELRHADADAKLLVTTYLPGQLVLDSPGQDDPETYRQAGELLAAFHGQSAVVDDSYEQDANDKALRWLSGAHRIEAATVGRLQAQIAAWPTPPAVLTPTHGDWQPRNWLIHRGIVSVIDLGRAALRPPMTDLARLAAQDFRRDASLEAAFLEGYGRDPREPDAWYRTRVREAIGTAAWAYQVGAGDFEAQGHRMISEVLAGR